ALFFHLLIGKKVFPVRVVLRGGDAGACGVLQGEFCCFASLRRGGRRNLVAHQAHGGLTKNTCGLAFVITIDLAAMWIRGLRGNTSSFERSAVGNGNVSVHTVENRWMTIGY